MENASNATAVAFARAVRDNIGAKSGYVFDGAGTLSYPLQMQGCTHIF